MKHQRHKRRDSFSVLLISHMGKNSRQLHVSTTAFRLLLFALFLICTAVTGLIVQIPLSQRQQQALRTQLTEQEALIRQLKEEKENLISEKQALARENEFLQLVGRSGDSAAVSGFAEDTMEETESDPAFPGRSPSSQMGMLIALYSQEQPYLSIGTHREDNLIAAGDGTITAITSDETWPLIIEVEHGNGYQTRYMCRQMAELQVAEHGQVKAGDILAVITSDNTQLDYQVIHEGEPIDPLNVIDAKG